MLNLVTLVQEFSCLILLFFFPKKNDVIGYRIENARGLSKNSGAVVVSKGLNNTQV